jgi:hypothetical protein
MTPPTGDDGPAVPMAPHIIRLCDLIGRVEERHHDPLDRVTAACRLSEELGRTSQALIRDCVARSWESGASWSDIAQVLGVSRQAAHRKYRAQAMRPGPTSQDGSAVVRTGDGAPRGRER